MRYDERYLPYSYQWRDLDRENLNDINSFIDSVIEPRTSKIPKSEVINNLSLFKQNSNKKAYQQMKQDFVKSLVSYLDQSDLQEFYDYLSQEEIDFKARKEDPIKIDENSFVKIVSFILLYKDWINLDENRLSNYLECLEKIQALAIEDKNLNTFGQLRLDFLCEPIQLPPPASFDLYEDKSRTLSDYNPINNPVNSGDNESTESLTKPSQIQSRKDISEQQNEKYFSQTPQIQLSAVALGIARYGSSQSQKPPFPSQAFLPRLMPRASYRAPSRENGVPSVKKVTLNETSTTEIEGLQQQTPTESPKSSPSYVETPSKQTSPTPEQSPSNASQKNDNAEKNVSNREENSISPNLITVQINEGVAVNNSTLNYSTTNSTTGHPSIINTSETSTSLRLALLASSGGTVVGCSLVHHTTYPPKNSNQPTMENVESRPTHPASSPQGSKVCAHISNYGCIIS